MLERLKTYRSIRKYDQKPVEEEVLHELLTAVLLAPTSRGLRPWHFIVVRDPMVKDALSRIKVGGGGFLREAPVVVVVTANPSISDVWVEDCSIAAYTLQLCAREKGLGSCWSQIRLRTDAEGKWAEENVREILNLPEQLAVDCIIAMGYPAEKKEPYTDKDGDWTKIHYDTY